MIEDNTVFTLIMIDACHSKKINNLLKKEKIAFTVYGCVDMKINSILLDIEIDIFYKNFESLRPA